jgi:hypothetical protein
MDLTPLDNYFGSKDEPMKGFLLALKDLILRYDAEMEVSCKWRPHFFSLGKNMICYLTIQNKTNRPYLGFGFGMEINHPALLSEGRKMIKVIYFDEEEDIDIDLLYGILKEVTQIARSKIK